MSIAGPSDDARDHIFRSDEHAGPATRNVARQAADGHAHRPPQPIGVAACVEGSHAACVGRAERANDLILLASYPKSGNTWLRAFLASLMANGSPIDINADLERIPSGADRHMFDTTLGVESIGMSAVAIAHARPRAWSARQAGATRAIWLKVHDAWAPFIPGCPHPYPACDVRAAIYVVRDPRDVTISFAHHFDISFDAAIDWMADENAMLDADPALQAPQLPQFLSSWSRHVSSWRSARDMPVLTVRYEDMHTAATETFGRIARWAGHSTQDHAIARAIEQSRFSRLQSQEVERGFVEGESRQQRFFRRGQAGGWRHILSPRQASRIVNHHGDVMRQFGYPT